MSKDAFPIFDCNASLGRRPNQRVSLDRTEDLLRVMDEAGISHALVYSPHGIHFGTDDANRLLLKMIGEQDRLKPQFVVNFSTDDFHEMEKLVERASVRTFRIFPNSHRYPFVEWVAGPWLKWMEERGMALWVPMGLRQEVDVRDLYETSKRHPRVPVVLAGSHYTNYGMVWPLLRALDHIYFDLSRFDLAEGVTRLIDHIGVARLLFGSDFPEVDPKPYLYYLKNCGLTPLEMRTICNDNLSRLLFRDGLRS